MARERRDIPLELFERRERELAAKRGRKHPPHDCDENVEYVEFDGPLGQAYYCSICGALLQVG